MFTGRTPDITLGQALAAIQAIVAQFVAWGWLDTVRSQTLVSVGSYVLAIGWLGADAYLRAARASAHVPASPSPPPPDQVP